MPLIAFMIGFGLGTTATFCVWMLVATAGAAPETIIIRDAGHEEDVLP